MKSIFAGFILTLMTVPAWAGLKFVDKIYGVGELDVATFFAVSDGKPEKIALLGIAPVSGNRISAAFNPGDLIRFKALVVRAVAAQSSSWQTIGTFNETETDDPSVVTVSAGVGVQIVISSPAKGA